MTEYTRIVLDHKISDPCSASLTAGKTVQIVANEALVAGGKPVPRRRIVRDGSVVTITCLESGRSREVPWSRVAESTPVAAPVAAQAKK